MNQTTTIEIPIGSGIDGLIGILIIVGAIIGYKRGVIVECIGFFAVLVILTISVNISKWLHLELASRSEVPDLFANIVMTVCFVAGLVFVVSKVTFRTQIMLQSTILGGSARALGAVFGAFKYYLISAVFLVTLFKIEDHAQFLPDEAKYSRLSKGSIWVITSIFPYLKLEKNDHSIMPYPNETNTERR